MSTTDTNFDFDVENEAPTQEGTNLPVKALPNTKAGMLAERLNKSAANLHDMVEQVLLDNMDDPKLEGYLKPWEDAQSVTGKCMYDDFKAAERLQELSKGNPLITDVKTTVILKSMTVVLRRFGQTRRQRIATAEAQADRAAARSGYVGE